MCSAFVGEVMCVEDCFLAIFEEFSCQEQAVIDGKTMNGTYSMVVQENMVNVVRIQRL
jgi:hypothetical protein